MAMIEIECGDCWHLHKPSSKATECERCGSENIIKTNLEPPEPDPLMLEPLSPMESWNQQSEHSPYL